MPRRPVGPSVLSAPSKPARCSRLCALNTAPGRFLPFRSGFFLFLIPEITIPAKDRGSLQTQRDAELAKIAQDASLLAIDLPLPVPSEPRLRAF